MKLYIDTETCGLFGLPVLIQYAYGDGEIILYEVWKHPVWETLLLLEEFTKHDWIMFNAAFDAFQLCKLYTTLSLVEDKDEEPQYLIREIADCEEKARFVDICYKPKSCCDLMLLARKGKYQSLMKRDPVRIKRIPKQLSFELARELEQRVKLDDIYFAKAKDKYGPRWKVYDIKEPDGSINPHFNDVVLTFKAAGSLKALARHALGVAEPILFSSIEVAQEYWPVELGYAPYANAIYRALQSKSTLLSKEDHKKLGPWPEVIHHHIAHWSMHTKAREYAANDIVFTRRLYLEHFNSPEPGDVDSTLACMVAACRWRGYAIDAVKLRMLKQKAKEKIKKTPTSPKGSRGYILEVMDEIDMIGLRGSTKKKVLEDVVATWKNEDGSMHPGAVRAKEVLDARQAIKEIEIYDKLLLAGRFHASFIVVGALSSRMSGSDGLNPQGIKHDKYVREAFTLVDDCDDVHILCGGDFKSFEVGIACAVYEDEDMERDIRSGIKVHAVLGQEMYPHYTYEQILSSDGNGSAFPEGDMYDTGKKGIFSIFYAGDENTWKTKLGIPIEHGIKVIERLRKRYKGIKRSRDICEADFGALKQPGGIGSRVEWHEPKEFVESLLGFKRFFTLEIKIAKILFKLGEKPPEGWAKIKTKVQRRIEKIQTAGGAVRSACYGAAFSLVSSMIRAALNHKIQSVGAEITKAVQRAAWDLQPAGYGPWIVQPMNIHDEIMCPTRRGHEAELKATVEAKVQEFRDRIPLLAIDWFTDIPNWASKKGKA